jgi:hypothetical protein
MTVKERLIKEGYTFQPECGCWITDDSKFLYSYLQDPESVGDNHIWNFEKVDQDGNLVEQHLFTEYSFMNY